MDRAVKVFHPRQFSILFNSNIFKVNSGSVLGLKYFLLKRFCESHQIEPNYGVVDYCEFITNIAQNEEFKGNPRNPRTEYIKD